MLTNDGRVVVVGAGPSGLTAALTLARRGVDVTVLDRSEQGTNTSRAAVVHARTLEVLESSGVTASLLQRAIRVPHFVVRDRDRTIAQLDLSALPSAYPYAAMISQADTERILREHLAAAGVRVSWRAEVVDLTSADDGVVVTVADTDGGRGTDGGRRQIRADVVVAADGMHSRVRSLTGIGFPGSTYEQSFVLADVAMDWPLPRDAVSLTFAPAGLVVTAPLPGDRFRIVATADDPPEQPDAATVQALLRARARAGTVHDVAWSGRFRVHHRIADTFRRDRVFLVGDAAHVHSPAGGQGMNLGIQDAATLAGVLADGADPDEYEALRRPVAARILRLTDLATRAATRDAVAARAVRNLAVRTVTRVPVTRRRLAMALAELDTPPRHRTARGKTLVDGT